MPTSGSGEVGLQVANLADSVDLVVVITVVVVLGMIFFLYLMFRRSFMEFKKGMKGE